jgi:large subunit ribosomal protein L19
MNTIIKQFESTQVIRKTIAFKVGDTVKVSLRIKEGEKERIQAYEGVVIGLQGRGPRMRFTVRKLSYGVGVEKTFYYQSPMIKEIKVSRSGKVRRGKLFYLRGKLTKKGARIQESKRAIKVPGEETAESTATLTPETVAPAPAEVSAPVAAPAQAETPKKG